MSTDASHSPLPPDYEDRIRTLESRERDLEAELTKVRAQVAWWREGLALFGVADEGVATSPVVPPALAAEATRVDDGEKPKLRVAVLRIFLDMPTMGGHEQRVQAGHVISELKTRGWQPGGKNSDATVRHMLRDLVERGQLEKPAYGVYALAPSMRSGLEQGGGGL